MYTAGLTAVFGFPPRLPDININTCRRDGLHARRRRRRGAIRNDRGADDDDDDDPFSAAYNNCPSPCRRTIHRAVCAFSSDRFKAICDRDPVKPRRYVAA